MLSMSMKEEANSLLLYVIMLRYSALVTQQIGLIKDFPLIGANPGGWGRGSKILRWGEGRERSP